MSATIAPLGRVFCPRLEVIHGDAISSTGYRLRLDHIDELGRHPVGQFDEAHAAYHASLLWHGRVTRVVCVEVAP